MPRGITNMIIFEAISPRVSSRLKPTVKSKFQFLSHLVHKCIKSKLKNTMADKRNAAIPTFCKQFFSLILLVPISLFGKKEKEICFGFTKLTVG